MNVHPDLSLTSEAEGDANLGDDKSLLNAPGGEGSQRATGTPAQVAPRLRAEASPKARERRRTGAKVPPADPVEPVDDEL